MELTQCCYLSRTLFLDVRLLCLELVKNSFVERQELPSNDVFTDDGALNDGYKEKDAVIARFKKTLLY